MAFSDQLQRLRAALLEGQAGLRENVIVQTADLRELLFHFDRLDRKIRDAAAAAPDMRSALKAFLDVTDIGKAGSYTLVEAQSMARAALAKHRMFERAG